MNLFSQAIRQVAALFVDDAFLAMATVAVVGGTALVLGSSAGAVGGEISLLGGCLAALVASVWRGARSICRARLKPVGAAR
jgi:hypothetical protein